MSKLAVALIQLKVGTNLVENLQRASELITCAVNKQKLDLVSLPECFNSPYGINFFKQYAESVPNGKTCEMLACAAKTHNVHIIGGTIPEIDNGKYYNTCTVWNPNGEMIGKYRKMHLFDIDIPGKITFKESDILSAGSELCTVCIKGIKVGLGICYDLRFNELATIYRKMGCDLLIYPAAFNTTTGPIHWEYLQKGRAIDNQVFVCCISPARNEKGYIAYGFSQITDPWGAAKTLKENEDILYDTLDFSLCEEVRKSIPVFEQRRNDIYEVVAKNKK